MAETNMFWIAFIGEPKDWLLPLGVMLLVVWALMRLANRRKRGGRFPTAGEQLEQNHQARGLRGDMEKLMVEIEQFAKRIGAQLDAKAHRLESLIEEAEEKIDQLQTTQSSAPRRETDDPSVAPPLESSQQLAAVNNQTTEPDDPFAQSVYRLADAGMEPKNIAAELSEHIGKIELILALRNTQG